MQAERANELWEQFLAGTLNDARASELLAYLQQNPEELERRRAEAAVHGGLEYLLGQAGDGQRLSASVLARLNAETSGTPDVGSASGEGRAFKQRVMQTLHVRRKRRTVAGTPLWLIGAAAAVLVLGLFAWRGMGDKTPQGPVAKIEMLNGGALLGGSQRLEMGSAEFRSGQKLELDRGARVRVTLPDGSEVRLGGDSVLVFANAAPLVLKLERGVADVEARTQRPGETLQIETPHARVKVLGTKYRVLAGEDTSRVDVEHGKVSVAPLAAGGGPERTLEKGQTVAVDAKGVGAVLVQSRQLAVGDASAEQFTDPVQVLASDATAAWPVRRLNYTRPKQGLGYGGMLWKVGGLQPGEEEIEFWIRPRKVELHDPNSRLMKVVLMASTGPTEYRLGDVHIFTADRDWMLVRGRFEGASVNWQEPGSAAVALKPESVRHLSVRTEIGNIEFDFGPIILHKRAR